MAMKLMDGFDKYSASSELALAGHVVAGTVGYGATDGKFGGGAVYVGNATANTITFAFPVVDASTTNKIHLSFWMKVTDLPASTVDVAYFYSSLTTTGDGQRLRVNAAGDLEFGRFGYTTAIGTISGCFADLGYHHIEIEGLYKNSGGSLKVWRDGVLQVNYSGDTYELGDPATIDRFVLKGNSSCMVYLDDIVIWDDVAGDFNAASPVGETRIETRAPNADSVVQFTPSTGTDNYALIDETSGHNGDTDYVQSTGIGNKDLYDIADLGRTPIAIHCVAVKAIAKKTDTGSVTMSFHAKAGATDGEGSALALTSGYLQYSSFWGASPATAVAWTPSELEAATFGFEYQA